MRSWWRRPGCARGKRRGVLDLLLHRLQRTVGPIQLGPSRFPLGENVALPLQEFTDLPEEEINRIVKMKLGMINLGFIPLISIHTCSSHTGRTSSLR